MQRILCLWALSLAFACGATGAVVRSFHPDPFIDAMLAAEYENSIRSDTQYTMKNKKGYSTCFNHSIDCFTLDDTYNSGYLPQDPGKSKIKMFFHLYSRATNDTPVFITYWNESSYTGLDFLKNSSKPLYVISHGFIGSLEAAWVVEMRKALLFVQDAYVLAVDWRRGCTLPFYNRAVANTMSVGRATAYLLSEIYRIYDYNPKNIHFIGFSLGAQLAGFAGRHFYRLTNQKFGRMTLLDPAAPSFEHYGVHARKNDSAFTVAIHTSAGNSILTGRLGMTTPVGHIDFYANGGRTQPSCRFYDLTCHHRRAYRYFIEAILSMHNTKACHFKARHCVEDMRSLLQNKCTITGDTVGEMSLTQSGDGVMYFETNGASPFCVRSAVDGEEDEDEIKNVWPFLKAANAQDF